MFDQLNRRGIAAGVIVLVASAAGIWWLSADKAGKTAPSMGAGMPMRAAAVIAERPQLKPFAQEVEALGTVLANESVDITAKVADRVAAIHFKEGQQVTKGQLLVELDSAEARADLAAAEAAYSDSQSQFKRSQELYQTRALSEAQLDQLRATLLANEARVAAARSRVNDRRITAPFSGRVGLRNVSLGGLVSPGQIITTLDDLSIVKLDFSVPEVFLSVLKPDMSVQAQSNAYPGDAFAGRVLSIGTRVDPMTRSVVIRAQIDNRDGRLRPGMFMTVKLVRAENDALMVSERAIVPENDRHFVFVVDGDRARKTQITIGRRRPGEVEVLQGVTPEDQVIVDGVLNLRDGSPIDLSPTAAHANATTVQPT